MSISSLLEYSKHQLIKTQWFKNLLAEIWHLNTQKYKNLFSYVKSSRLFHVGYSQILINILTKEFDFEFANIGIKILYRTVITNRRSAVIRTTKTVFK